MNLNVFIGVHCDHVLVPTTHEVGFSVLSLTFERNEALGYHQNEDTSLTLIK